jgi:hypothetical protein
MPAKKESGMREASWDKNNKYTQSKLVDWLTEKFSHKHYSHEQTQYRGNSKYRVYLFAPSPVVTCIQAEYNKPCSVPVSEA